MKPPDLTPEEQERVRIALRFLRGRYGDWATVAKAIGFDRNTIKDVTYGHPVSARLAFRIARHAQVGIDDLLAGAYPPAGTCPKCGHTSVAAQ